MCRGLFVHRVDLGLVEVVELAGIVDREVAHRDWLVASGDQAEQERADLTGQIVLLLVRQILARVRGDRDEATDLEPERTEALLDLRRRQRAQAPRITGLLE